MVAHLRHYLPAAWLVGLAGALLVAAGPDAVSATATSAALAVLVACASAAVALCLPAMGHLPQVAVEPALNRLRGRFSQQSRPGVPGRVRARAPGR